MRNRSFVIAGLILILSTPLLLLSVGDGYEEQLVTPDNGISNIVLPELVEEIFEAVSEQSFRSHIEYLSDTIGPRAINTEGNNETIDWLVDKLEGIEGGVLEVEVFGNWRSVIGKYIPEGGSSSVILVGGHFDTVYDSPGADDNASGVSYMLELARVLSGYDWDVQIWFCGFNNEEYGLRGSYEIATHIVEEELNLLCAMNADMILSKEVLPLYYFSEIANSFIWPATIQLMSETYGSDIVEPVDGWAFGGNTDHFHFLLNGFNTTTAFDGTHPYWHTPQDTYDQDLYNYDVGTEFTAATAAAVALAIGFPEIFNGDQDGDNLPDIIEEVIGTDMGLVDSDSDLLSDALEYELGTNPNSSDSDNDTLSDSAEVNTYGTNPLRSDSDSDSMPDAFEVIYGLNPIADDADLDLDQDGLLNIEEYNYGTFPNDSDSDDDFVSDFDEIMVFGSNPFDKNSDGDFFDDNIDLLKTSPLDLPLFIGSGFVIIALLLVVQRTKRGK